MIKNDTILYSINVEDVQTVAEEELGRKLTNAEITSVEGKLGDYIDWHKAVENAVINSVQTAA